MEPIIPPEVNTDAFLGFTALPAAALVAGIIQAFIRSGLHVRHAQLLGLVIGIALSVIGYASLGGVLVVAVVQGLVIGFAGHSAWAHFSSKINTNGE